MFELFVGDLHQSLPKAVKKYDRNTLLLKGWNVDAFLKVPTPTGTAYASIEDIRADRFLTVCNKADKIYYRPSEAWLDLNSDNNSKKITEAILAGLSQYIPVDGIQKIIDQKPYFNDDFLKSHRKTDLPQLWFSGCSITYGRGVFKDQTFKEIIAQKLRLQYTDLSHPGSSIIWQSDQICRSDIKTNDIVFWGLTTQHRLPVFDPAYERQNIGFAQGINDVESAVIHIYSRIYEREPKLKFKFPNDLIDSTTLIYHNILAVRRAYNFCQKIGAQLVILGLMYDVDNIYLHYNVPAFRQSMIWPKKYPDVGTDATHPGPKSHQMFATEFLDFYSKLYPADLVAKD
jgi:hypothetical protein